MTAQMSSQETLISVIVPHLNQPESLDICLSSLDDQTLARPLFEVIVVDNGSTCCPASVVARHPQTVLLHELEAGPGPARNRGVQHATGKILAFIDADCRAAADWLSTIYQTLCSVPEGTVLGGDVQIWRANRDTFTAIEAYEAVFSYRFKLFIEQHGYCGTGNMAVRRSDFDKVGPFAGIRIAEDVEWGERARAAGLTFRYIPEIVVFHPARASLQELYSKWGRHLQHVFNATRGKPAWKVYWIARAIAVFCSPLIDGATIMSSDRLHGIMPRAKAFLVLGAIRAYRAWKMIGLLGSSGEVVWNRQP
jgi:glycosyltransferase involved in cell wall biosynthesis